MLPNMVKATLEQRFKDKIEVIDQSPTVCWPWSGAIDSSGYGWLKDGSKTIMAHKLSYQLKHGPIPDGYLLKNTCGLPNCVNNAHWILAPRKRSAIKVGSSVLIPQTDQIKQSIVSEPPKITPSSIIREEPSVTKEVKSEDVLVVQVKNDALPIKIFEKPKLTPEELAKKWKR